MKDTLLEGFYKKYYNEALYYTYSLCKNITIAEDIVSDAFLKAINNVSEDEMHFKYWLLKVCKNLYIDYLRKNKNMQHLDKNIANDESTILHKLIKKEEYIALHNAINLLDTINQEVIRLFYFENLTIKEIGKIINASDSNVKVLLYRSREKLRQLLEVKK